MAKHLVATSVADEARLCFVTYRGGPTVFAVLNVNLGYLDRNEASPRRFKLEIAGPLKVFIVYREP